MSESGCRAYRRNACRLCLSGGLWRQAVYRALFSVSICRLPGFWYDDGAAQQRRVHVDIYRALTVGITYSPAFVSKRVESPFEAAAVAACASTASAEHLREEVREASSCKLAEIKSFKAACVCTACGTAAHACHFPVFAVLVVFGPFFRIVQHIVRFIQCLEFGFGFRVVGMQVRVELFGPFSCKRP